ncbi:MAG: T9SS type A sorting domain-containing protein [Phaeodactylibacter sp.]|nr:T9SS type A sorting domain-containing protein [Phaeodactylibacter sp.]
MELRIQACRCPGRPLDNPAGKITWTAVIASAEYEALSHLMTDNGFIYFGGTMRGNPGLRRLVDLYFYKFSEQGKNAAFLSHVNYQAELEVKNTFSPDNQGVTNYFTVFPNPTQGIFTVANKNENVIEIRIFGILGNLIHAQTLLPEERSVDFNLQGQPDGFFVVAGYDQFGNVVDQIKLIKGN